MSAAAAPPLGPVILDSGGVLAYLSGQPFARRLYLLAQQSNHPVILPTAVYAQVERRQSPHSPVRHHVNALLNLCTPAPLSMTLARQVGILLGLSGTSDIVDAVVVVEALRYERAIILTSDSGDLRHLLSFSSDQYRRSMRVVPV